MNPYVRKRDKLLSVVNRLHVEGLIALEEINSIHNKDNLKNVVCPLLLEDNKITNTIEIEPGNGAKISCRGYLLRQKRYEGSSSCDSCGHIVFKLFPISETETQQLNSKDKCLNMKVCKTCLNEHSGHQISGKKIQKKEIPPLTEYLPNGMTSARASNSWHFIRKDICAYKSSKRPLTQKLSCLSDFSDLSEEEMEPFPMHVKNDLISVLRKPAKIDVNILKNDPNFILFPSFVDDIPILISPHIKGDPNLDFVKTVVNNMLFDLVEHVVCTVEKNRKFENLPNNIITELLKNIENKINIVIDNDAVNIVAVDSSSIFPFKSNYKVVEGVECEKKKKVIRNKIEMMPYAGVCSLVTPISCQKGHFIYNASRSCLYNSQGLVMKNEHIPSYLQPKIEKAENYSYRTRKRTLDVFLHKKMEDGCAWKSLLPERLDKIEVKESKDDLLDENHNGFDKKNVFSTEPIRVQPLETSYSSCICVTCKKVFNNSKASFTLTNGPKTLGKFSKIDALVCEDCTYINPHEALKKKNNIENSKNSTKWSIIPEIKQEIVAAKDLNPLKRKIPNATGSDRSEMKLKPPDKKQETVDLTKPSNVNVKLIKNPSTRVLEEIVTKRNGKYLILQSSSTSLTNDCINSSNGPTASDIMINGKSYKIDTEFKLNDLLKDNEAAHKHGTSQKAFLAQLPGILQRSLNQKKISVQNKVVSIASSQFESMKRNVHPASVKQSVISTLSPSTQKDSLVSQASTTVRLPAPSFSSKSINSCRPSTTYISIKPAPEKVLSSAPEKKLDTVTVSTKSSIGSKCLSFTPTVNPNNSTQDIISTYKSTSAVNIPINQSCKLSSLATAFQLKPAHVKPDQKVKLLSASQVLRIKNFSPSVDSLNIVDKVTQASPNDAEKSIVKSLLSGPKLTKTPLSVAEKTSSSDQALI